MNPIVSGVKKFQREVYPDMQPLFGELAKKQEPKVLFITCSDSRVDPALITQTPPGSLFMVQNAGNIVPPHGSPFEGTAASIEYAVSVLNVEHIVVCGHKFCGAMAALLDNPAPGEIPAVIRHWISYADTARAIVEAEAGGLSREDRLKRCIERNVQVQLSHLKTLPSVAAKLAANKLTLHGWVYNLETGGIDVCPDNAKEFVAFDEAYSETLLAHT